MVTQKRVLVYGRSLNLAGITACLKLDPGMHVDFINPNYPAARQSLDDLNPETIIFDLTDMPSDLDLNLLQNRPGLLLIGVDPSSNEVLVLTGQRNKVVTLNDLLELVSNHVV